MRLVYNDPYALRGAVEQLAGQQPIATRRERDRPLEGAEVGVKSNRRKAWSK